MRPSSSLRRDALQVATLSPYPHHRPMPTTTTADAWPPERIDRLAAALLPVAFPDRAAPAPAADNLVLLDSRRLSRP